jgi:hypothetical protein
LLLLLVSNCVHNDIFSFLEFFICIYLWFFTMNKRVFCNYLATQFLSCRGHL